MDYVERKAYYFKNRGKENTEKTIEFAKKRAEEGDIKHVVVATHGGASALKVADASKDMDIKVTTVTVYGGTKKEWLDEWEKNLPELEKRGVQCHRGVYTFAGVERAIKARWGGAGPAQLMGDALRTLGDGVKVGVEISCMAADAGLIPVDQDVITIAGTGGGADTAMVIRPTYSSKFFDLGIKEIICKPLVDGVRHEAR